MLGRSILLIAVLAVLTPGAVMAEYTLAERLAELAPARERVVARFAAADIPYPPTAITLAAFKDEHRLEICAKSGREPWRAVTTYPVLQFGRGLGPKLREGDFCTPEGLYRLTNLNPNSDYHLSLALDYPNASDRAQAARDGRTDLGGDIVIHGGKISIGCLAVGDDIVEDLFVLAADVGLDNVRVVIAPRDFRAAPPTYEADDPTPAWTRALYATIAEALAQLPPVQP